MLRFFTTHVQTCLASNQVNLPKVELKFFSRAQSASYKFCLFSMARRARSLLSEPETRSEGLRKSRNQGSAGCVTFEEIALSARLRREDKVMLSCLNSMTSFRKTRVVLRDWYLIDLLLKEKYVLPAVTPVSLKSPEFLRGKLVGVIGVQVISHLLPDFSPFRCSCFKTIWFCYENFPY